MRRHDFIIRCVQLAAWGAIAVIAYATLAHVSLVYLIYFKVAPWLLDIGMKRYFVLEPFGAFALLGVVFCFAYPKRLLMICFIVFGSAIALELMQTLTPDRHATILDVIEKLADGACGIFVARTMLNWRRPSVRMDA